MIFALGAFDGFHMGHQKLLEMASLRAAEKNVKWGIITFNINPQQLLSKSNFKLLFTDEEREVLLHYFKVSFIDKIPFTLELASMAPENFLDFIRNREKIDGLVIGENFRFGKERKGTPEKLSYLCKKNNWSLDVLDTFKINNNVVSSTSIREAVLKGDLDKAFKMLGFPFIISGRVEKGDGRGRMLGYPTANIKIYDNKVYPATGSYSALTYIKGKWHVVALNIGYNVTFTEKNVLTCEAHVLEFDGNLYGENLMLFLIKKNREEVKFTNSKKLKVQLKEDVQSIKQVASSYLEKHSSIIKKFEQNYFDM